MSLQPLNTENIEVKLGDEVMLYHATSGTWLGKPTYTWNGQQNKYTWQVPLTTQETEIQPFRIEGVQGSTTLTAMDRFVLRIPEQRDLILSVPLHNADTIGGNVQERVELGPLLPEARVTWQWVPTVETSTVHRPLYYGYAAGLFQENARAYLLPDTAKQYATVHYIPRITSTTQGWVFVPTKPLYTCLSTQKGLCAEYKGQENARLQLNCDLFKGECYNYLGEQVFSTAAECQAHCFVTRYQCSGQPHYRCEVVKGTQEQTTYDECIESCHAPTSAKSAKSVSFPSSPSSSVPFRFWWFVGLILGICLVSLFGVWHLGK